MRSSTACWRRRPFLNVGAVKENRAEFQRLLEALLAECAPAGPLEELCVERIALATWRARRAVRAEAASLYEARRAAEQEAWSATDTDSNPAMSGLIERLQTELNRGSTLSADLIRNLADAGVGWMQELAGQARCWQGLIAKESDLTKNQIDTERWHTILTDLRRCLPRRLAALATAQRRGRRRAKRSRLVFAIPSPGTLAHLWRYETMHNRELDRALGQLRELQRERHKREARPTRILRNKPTEPEAAAQSHGGRAAHSTTR